MIGTFQIPPFLLPMYQAAGIQYDVPWQVLAAINWIETDYGRNLSVSSAGAIGWMQFMPSTWAHYGLDVTGNGIKNPYNPIDAIFAAARYLHAAGASNSLPKAIYAYNHANWYVQSVLLRARLISAYPAPLIDALTGLMQARFPVAGQVLGYRQLFPARGDGRQRPQDRAVIFAPSGAPAVAVADGAIVKIGHDTALGRYAILEDAYGNTYTYARLGSIAAAYAVPKLATLPAARLADELMAPRTTAPRAPATNGAQTAPRPANATRRSARATPPTNEDAPPTATTYRPRANPPASEAAVKERLFAHPHRPVSYAAGGMQQLSVANPGDYFANTLTLPAGQYTLAPLRLGARVLAGTILGRLQPSRPHTRSSLTFMIAPAGKHSAPIDPEPILRSWALSSETGMYGTDATDAPVDLGARDPTVGQVLLMSKPRLERQILEDRAARIYACGRRDIRAGLVDRRVLAVIEYLTVLDLRPTVSGLVCGQAETDRDGTSLEISQVDDIPVLGHQGPESPTALAIRALLALQGPMRPAQIISLHSTLGQPNTLALPDHAEHIEVDYKPATDTGLTAHEWKALAAQLSTLPEPTLIASPPPPAPAGPTRKTSP